MKSFINFAPGIAVSKISSWLHCVDSAPLSANNPQQSQPMAAGTVKPYGFASPCAQRYAQGEQR